MGGTTLDHPGIKLVTEAWELNSETPAPINIGQL